MLLCHVTTNDLLVYQDDLTNSRFAGWYWQHGSDGALTTAGVFTGANISLNDKRVDGVGGSVEKVADRNFQINRVMNIAGSGLYHVVTITDNRHATLRQIPSYSARVVEYAGVDASFVAVTGAEWSYGGWEHKILAAYIHLLDDLSMQGVGLTGIEDTDMTFNSALTYKALELVCVALITEPDGVMNEKTDRWNKLYNEQLTMQVKKFSPTASTVEAGDWGRTS